MTTTNENYVKKLIEDDSRIDNRAFDQFRDITIETDYITSAEGSAKVTIGKTLVIAGVKMEVKEPYPDTPNEGMLTVDAELVPLASPTFEPGPPDENAIEIARVVDRGIRECHAIDMEKLCIEPEKLAWSINIDIHVLDHDGNLIDACGLAAIAALLSTKIPQYNKEKNQIIRDGIKKEDLQDLPMVDIPIPITINKISRKLFIDANVEEENAIESRVTITSTKNKELCAIQKGGTGYFTIEELEQAADISLKKGEEIRNILRNIFKYKKL